MVQIAYSTCYLVGTQLYRGFQVGLQKLKVGHAQLFHSHTVYTNKNIQTRCLLTSEITVHIALGQSETVMFSVCLHVYGDVHPLNTVAQ